MTNKKCPDCGKTYYGNICSCGYTIGNDNVKKSVTKESMCGKLVNTDKCDICGGKASVYPSRHYGAGYLLKELTMPKRWYCEKCYYDLIKKDNSERVRLNPKSPVNIEQVMSLLSNKVSMPKVEEYEIADF